MLATLDQRPLLERIAISAYALRFYLRKTLLPLELAAFYELPQSIDPFARRYVASLAFVVAVTLFLFGLRTEIPAQGLLGGRSGSPRRYHVNGQPIPPKGRLDLQRGQTLTITEAGGGGWGDPRHRDPARVHEDVQRGFVTPAAALRDYGVVP